MKGIKKENGMITIEASLSFILFMFLILFIYCFSNIYIAQNQVSHAALQVTENIALESYGREKFSEQQIVSDANDLLSVINDISGTFFRSSTGYQVRDLTSIDALTDENFKEMYKKAWAQSLTDASQINYQQEAKQKLERLGVDMDTICFDIKLQPSADGSGTDIVTTITYDVYLEFPFMGKDKIEGIKKQSKSRLFTSKAISRSVSWVGL